MKQVLNSPVIVNVEVNIIEDIIRIIGQSIHRQFTFDDIDGVKHVLMNKRQAAIEAAQVKTE